MINKEINNNSKLNNVYKKNINKEKDVIITITETANNLFITISKLNGLIISKSSSGQMKFQKRNTPLSVEVLGMYIGKQLLDKGFKSFNLVISHLISKLVRSAIRGLKKNYIVCKSIKLMHNLTHNGVRLPVAKRK